MVHIYVGILGLHFLEVYSRRYDSDYQWGEGLEVEDTTEKGNFYFSFHAFS